MILAVAITFVDLFFIVFNFLLLVRVIMSWFTREPERRLATRLVYELTEPVLAPVRRLLPRSEVVDLSPIITFFALQLLDQLIHHLTGLA